MQPSDKTARAEQIYDESIVWDNVWPLEPDSGNGFDKLSHFARCGYDVISLTIAGDRHNISEAVQRVAEARRHILAHADQYILIETVSDIHRAKVAGKLGVALHFEGARCFERNLDMIEAFYKLGVKHTLLAFNQANSVGGGCAEEGGGLTRFGRQFVRELEQVGMLLDLSHTGERTTLDAMEIATKPVVFTHSNAASLTPHYRNLTDTQIKACADLNGLIGISGSSSYLGDHNAKIETVFRHIDYVVQMIGPKHVGLGLDIVFDVDALNDYIRSRPDEWPGTSDPNWPGFRYVEAESVKRLPELMLDAGYPEEEIRGILGGNYIRICEEVWR